MGLLSRLKKGAKKAVVKTLPRISLGASIAADQTIVFTDIEKVLKETDAPYAPMTKEIAMKAYEYMVKGKIGRLGPELVKIYMQDDKLIWDHLKENLETLLQCYQTGDTLSERFMDAENGARWYLHATLAALIASTDDKLRKYFNERMKKIPPGEVLHELMKKKDVYRDLTWYLDPETGEKVEKTPHSVSWRDPLSNINSVRTYMEDKIEWYKTLPEYVSPVLVPVRKRK